MAIPAETLRRFAREQLTAAGMDPLHAAPVAEVLVEGDLLGHQTHGLALLPRYLAELDSGQMAGHGLPQVTHREGSVAEHWDGGWLPGPSLVRRAIGRASDLARAQGLGAIAIARSHHIACLAAYLQQVTEAGLAVILASSSPSNRQVAPFGGVEGVYSPNPIAAGWPTDDRPVLIDISMSITTSGMVTAMAQQGRPLPGDWLVTQDGAASADPALIARGDGALLPLGGLDHGHKGLGLGLLVEMLTGALTGHGRAEGTDRWGAEVFVLVLDPDHFGGRAAFARQAGWIAQACRAAQVAPGAPPVRLPGDNALARRARQLADGVSLSAPLLARLRTLGLDAHSEEETPQ